VISDDGKSSSQDLQSVLRRRAQQGDLANGMLLRNYVTEGDISIHSIHNHDQQADYLTKPVNAEVLTKLRQLVQGW
jgi:hypothetical protein